MKQLRRIFHKRSMAAIGSLLFASVLSLVLMVSCNDEQTSKPTAPSIPVGPDWQTSENSNEMGFYSAKGDGQFGAFFNGNNEFQISVPAGEFLLTYVANGGTYYVAFRAMDAAILYIGMHPGVTVSEASVQRGKITNQSQKNWQSNSVILFAWPGSDLAWDGAFQSDGSAVIVLIANQQVASGVNRLPEPQPVSNPGTNPQPQPTANPTVPPNPQACVVSNANDSGDGSLRQLLTNAACPTITFASGVTKISLAGTQLTVARNVLIHGGSGVIISGNNLSRVFYVNSGVTASFAGLTITGGQVSDSGAGIWNKGTLTLESSTAVSGNRSLSGGGIYNEGTLTINGSVNGNIAGGAGGGINNRGILSINGVVSDNKAGEHGGGILNILSGVVIINGTVKDNAAGKDGGGIENYTGTGTLTLNAGHLIEGNHADSDDLYGSTGGGIFTNGECPGNANYGNGNYSGSGTTTIDNCNGSGVTPPPDNNATTFVSAHNSLRQAVTQPANYSGTWATIPNVSWSDTVAQHAQAWADTLKAQGCIGNHDPNRVNEGENLAWGSGLTPQGAVDMWGNEKSLYTYNPVYSFDTNTGHYTQIVWRSSTQIGCGIASCGTTNMIVCRYSPAGNMSGAQPY